MSSNGAADFDGDGDEIDEIGAIGVALARIGDLLEDILIAQKQHAEQIQQLIRLFDEED